jgi:hypothetical protein
VALQSGAKTGVPWISTLNFLRALWFDFILATFEHNFLLKM